MLHAWTYKSTGHGKALGTATVLFGGGRSHLVYMIVMMVVVMMVMVMVEEMVMMVTMVLMVMVMMVMVMIMMMGMIVMIVIAMMVVRQLSPALRGGRVVKESFARCRVRMRRPVSSW
jgi:hypothetical protein